MRHHAWIAFGNGLLACLLFSCGTQQEIPLRTNVKPSYIKVNSLRELGTYERVVPLETHNDALLGAVSEVKIDPVTTDILVSDSLVTQKVYRFDSEGRYLCRYGAGSQGPASYEHLLSFEILGDGQVALFVMGRALLFEANGELIKALPIDFNGKWAEVIDDKIFLYNIGGTRKQDTAITVLNEQLYLERRLHPYDERMRKLKFIPGDALTRTGRYVLVSSIYDFQITVYDQEGTFKQSFVFPNQNYQLDPFWQQSRDKMKSRKQLSPLLQNLHRAHFIYGLSDYVFILESLPAQGLLRANLLDIGSGQAFGYEGIRLVNAGPDAGYLSMTSLAGSHGNSLIGYCDDPDLFARYQPQYPVAKGIDFKDTDNPVLLFFAINIPSASGQLADRRVKHEQGPI